MTSPLKWQKCLRLRRKLGTPEPVDVNVQNQNEPIPVDDRLDFSKVK
ncbi:hypothetical protein Fisuc_1206 [Fibrobacter succinogenes subsp. succinogenes S85]|uniref:Uncharacterized protein n=1 Tax=Fibrobacter succinogenes (strain ATCC 19169 / S85) TaxID=59374 RepID=A0ABN3YTH2_FIBSS|nr:hypothetical protein Fisuc_1206 [Fibrobacter succinogenes subsp. succinogenes S85]